MKTLLFSIVGFLLISSSAFADSPYGIWRRQEDGSTYVFYKCGRDGLCAKFKSGPAANEKTIGMVIFRNGDKLGPKTWRGEVRNLPDGQIYVARITLTNDTTVLLDRCDPEGYECKSEHWMRAN